MTVTGEITSEQVRAALARLSGPGGGSLLDAVPEEGVAVSNGRVAVTLEIAADSPAIWEPIRAMAQSLLADLPGAKSAVVTLTAERVTGSSPPRAGTSSIHQTVSFPGRASARVQSPAVDSGRSAASAKSLPALAAVRHIVAVASGKGGVGKSTTACNLALALAARGLRVGVLDADVYGPSMPKLFGLKGQPRILSNRTLIPLEAFGLKIMSMGLVVDAADAMIWRGPMVASAITQMLRDVAWGELDVLVVDMPPGTGDAQLTLAQTAPLSGAVVVSTPQDLSLIDARRGIAMFRNVGVRVLGIVENMSYFVCDGCGKRHHVFANGGARAEAVALGVPFLGEIPLSPEIRERSDAGLPVVVTSPEGEGGRAYTVIAAEVAAALGI